MTASRHPLSSRSGAAPEAAIQEPAARASSGLRAPEGGLRWLALLLSLVPLYGFVLGVVYAAQPEPEPRRFGRLCLGLALFGLILFLGLAMLLRWLSGPAGGASRYF